jgi:hypothetical protein
MPAHDPDTHLPDEAHSSCHHRRSIVPSVRSEARYPSLGLGLRLTQPVITMDSSRPQLPDTSCHQHNGQLTPQCRPSAITTAFTIHSRRWLSLPSASRSPHLPLAPPGFTGRPPRPSEPASLSTLTRSHHNSLHCPFISPSRLHCPLMLITSSQRPWWLRHLQKNDLTPSRRVPHPQPTHFLHTTLLQCLSPSTCSRRRTPTR